MASCAVKGKPLPEWFKLLPPNARVNIKDVAKLFELTERSIRTAAYNGSFPKANFHNKGLQINNACMWKPDVLLTEWKRRGGLS